MNYQELRHLCLTKCLITEHIYYYSVLLRVTTIMLTIFIHLKACHVPLLWHKSWGLHDQNKKWREAKWRIMECVEGEEHRGGLRGVLPSTGTLTSYLPGSSGNCVSTGFLKRATWFMKLLSSSLSPLLLCEFVRIWEKLWPKLKGGWYHL